MRFTIDDKRLIKWIWVNISRRKTLAWDDFDRRWSLDEVKTLIIIFGFGIYGAAVVPDSGVGNTWQSVTLVLHEFLFNGLTPSRLHIVISFLTHVDHVFLGLPRFLVPGSPNRVMELMHEVACCNAKNGTENLQITHAKFAIFLAQNPDGPNYHAILWPVIPDCVLITSGQFFWTWPDFRWYNIELCNWEFWRFLAFSALAFWHFSSVPANFLCMYVSNGNPVHATDQTYRQKLLLNATACATRV